MTSEIRVAILQENATEIEIPITENDNDLARLLYSDKGSCNKSSTGYRMILNELENSQIRLEEVSDFKSSTKSISAVQLLVVFDKVMNAESWTTHKYCIKDLIENINEEGLNIEDIDNLDLKSRTYQIYRKYIDFYDSLNRLHQTIKMSAKLNLKIKIVEYHW